MCSDLPPNIYTLHETAIDRDSGLPEGSMAAHEKFAIQKALNQSNGNRQKASRILKISERSLYRKIKLYKLS
ncbi:MAG: hypothetical protein K9L30_14625 [Desulfobacterales bacterium]|nr:hypothetical protein [Desulfobacterales bacterium]